LAFLPLALLADQGRLGGIAYVDAVHFFPFPLHIQALVGTAAVLRLFRLVGLVWLVLAVLHALRRAGLG
jgi:hypothetical protein